MKQQIVKMERVLRENRWGLGLIDNGREAVVRGECPVKWIDNGCTDRWFADPFILDATDSEVTLLVEEFSYDIRRGRIARLVVDRQQMKVVDVKIILDIDSHLSFPFIFRRGGRVFVMPENSRAGSQNIYEYDGDALVNPVRVIDRPLADAIIAEIDGRFYLLSTEEPDANGSVYHLFGFDADNLTAGRQIGSYRSEGNTARNAGAIFEYNGELYRPAQKFGRRYGEAVVIQKIGRSGLLTEFEETSRLNPVRPFPIGLHTLNFYGDLAVIDGNAYRFPVVGPVLDSLAHAKQRLFDRE